MTFCCCTIYSPIIMLNSCTTLVQVEVLLLNGQTNRYEVFGDEPVLPVLAVSLPPPLALVLALLAVPLPLLPPLVLPLNLRQLPLPRRRRQGGLGEQQLLK